MTGEEVKALRKELGLSILALAALLKVEARTILAWEAGDLFPTKKHTSTMQGLTAKTAKQETSSAIAVSSAAEQGAVIAQLTNPALWDLIVKLATDPAFFAEVERLAKRPRS